ncbi:response regulator [Vulgatibacter incomptus]|uniref:response regulator n=1 Tax=Vulgatibacter incomptus TaxID=1391653 RepID=UPI0006803862|nr:response regulator [Vulgatibacter incomptus]
MSHWKIVIADDDDAVRRLLALAIGSFGHEIVEARDGLEAVERVLAHQPDAVFLDVLMPRMNGLEALSRLREQGYGGKIVVISALAGSQSPELETDIPPDAILAKPFRRRDVGDCLVRLAASVPSAEEPSASLVGNPGQEVAELVLGHAAEVGRSDAAVPAEDH